MDKLIKIPNVPRDERIGSVFNHLFHVILATNNLDGKNMILDFSNVEFFHPFFIFPLSIFCHEIENEIKYSGLSPNIINYLNAIKFFKPLLIRNDEQLKISLTEYYDKSYIPICKFSRDTSNIDSMQSVIQNAIENQYKIDKKFKTPLSYLLSELICNIKEHSKSKYGYIYTQYLKRENCLDICIADNGITIYGSYINAEKYLDVISLNEAVALKLANEGKSTKNRPSNENRGYGISTSKKMIVEGLGGEFFMMSGGAFHRYDNLGSSYIELPKDIQWNGTIILMRLPLQLRDTFDYYEYIK